MQPTYRVDRITTSQIDPAYLLISPVAPKLDLDDWRAFCRDVLAGALEPADRDSVVVAVNPRGYVQGLSVYAVRRHPLHGRTLDVSLFVVTSAADEDGVAIDLLRHLKEIARSETCGTLRIWTLEQDNWSRRLQSHDRDAPEHGIMMILDADAPLES